MIRSRGTDTLAVGLSVQCMINLTDKENLRIASGSKLRGINWEPISLCQSVEDAELDGDSYAYAVRTLYEQELKQD